MSQFYQSLPPGFPPEQDSERYDEGDFEYIEDNGRTAPLQLGLAFFGGGCVSAILLGICAIFLVAGLLLVDPSAIASAPTPEGMNLGLTIEEPAFPDEAVVNDQLMQLRILDVNRNASLETVPAVEGEETVIVTVELVNLGETDQAFNERDFYLVNALEESYEPVVGAVEGALGRGTLPPNEGLEGRLVFQVLAGEFDLRLMWDVGRDSEPRYLYLE